VSYVDHAYYERLVADFLGWPPAHAGAASAPDPRLKAECEALLFREARLLDERRFEDWLGLYAPECLLWIPGTVPAGDPREAVTVAFDDRRRLEDRIYRLRTGSAWSQAPASRTVRVVGNVEPFAAEDAPEHVMVRSTLLATELRAGETRLWSGWCAHRLRRTPDGLRIEVKQLNLVDADANLPNPSALF